MATYNALRMKTLEYMYPYVCVVASPTGIGSLSIVDKYTISITKMSFRDLRNFTEMMRVLGYPRLISLSNFQQPNFPLVAEILVWLVKRFDNDANVPKEHSTEQERIALIRYAAEFMIKTVNIRLNPKKLYMADGHAVKELLKVTFLLYEAQLQSTNDLLQSDNETSVNFDITDRLSDLKATRQLASQLTINGATLYDLLGREVELREIRNSKVANQYDASEIEVAVKEVIQSTKKEIDETKTQIENVKDTEQNLDTRIERRQTELERNQKRLQTLRKVRPAFMEEFEKLQVELKTLYDDYLQKFRYLAYLEHLYEDAAKVEQERFERRQAATKKQLEQLRIDDANIDSIIEGNDSIFNTNLQNSLALGEGERKPSENANPDARKSARMNITQRRLYGSMSGRRQRGGAGGTIREPNGSVASSDSDSDLLIDNIDDDDDDDDLLNSVDPAMDDFNSKHNNEEKRAMSKVDHTDDEF
ncbi:clusterin-associated protein 1 isoform X1 [Nasonia vitripennis]|uniref:Clusterin-associated protein 1 n=1 Tax=Nasonia vitripennis TaxID=7425 RepID=A0A7M7Q8J6_NASVI|nr:clusterin-associated protein 1 isoform X1 [Nasonia vitripennis]